MKSATIRLLKLGYSGKSPTEVVLAANVVIERSTSGACKIPIDPADPTVPSIAAIQTQLKTVMDAVRLPNSTAAAELRKMERNVLVTLLQKLGSYYEEKATGDRVLLATTGFDLKKEPGGRNEEATPPPEDFNVKQGKVSRQAIGTCRVHKSVNTLETEWSAQSDPNSPDWNRNGFFTKSRQMIFNDLPRGVDLWFRCRAHGPNGTSDWSYIATLMVV